MLELARERAVGCATGRGPVLYLALEEKRAEVREHFRAMGATADDPVFVFCAPSPADGLGRVRWEAERRRPALVIVDPLLRFVRLRAASDYAAVDDRPRASPGPRPRRGRPRARRPPPGEGRAERGRRNPRLDGRTLSSIQRYGPDLEPVTLVLDPDTRTLSAGPWPAEVEEARLGQAILAAVAGRGEAEEREIHAAVPGRK
ncbi:MAG: AAA family ATPase, partial [Candidatus Rokubacteria bacterium]|nr:AAA family ATPase [Candidatus Rokubacteria bacterium]